LPDEPVVDRPRHEDLDGDAAADAVDHDIAHRAVE